MKVTTRQREQAFLLFHVINYVNLDANKMKAPVTTEQKQASCSLTPPLENKDRIFK